MKSVSTYIEQSYLLEQKVFNMYLEKLKDSFMVRKNVVWKQQDIRYEFDIVIYDKQEHIIAVVEVKLNLRERRRTLSFAKDTIRDAFKITGSKYGIVTDGEIFYIFDREEGTDLDIQPVDFEKSINAIVQFERNIDVSSKGKDYNIVGKLLKKYNFEKAAGDIRQVDNQVVFNSIESENEFWRTLIEQIANEQ